MEEDHKRDLGAVEKQSCKNDFGDNFSVATFLFMIQTFAIFELRFFLIPNSEPHVF